MMGLDERRLNVLSDTDMYNEAKKFLDCFLKKYELPPNKQLIRLLTFSRSWSELIGFVKHQEGRDWVNKTGHKQFYSKLRRYLDNANTGLRVRVKSKFALIPDSATLNPKQECELQDAWAGALAHEFIQHLVAAALYTQPGE